jgi:putative ABC transport system permease protein
MLTELRQAFRTLRRAPLFSLTVIGTVMLGIAANAAMFSVLNAVLIRPLPFLEPDRIVQVAEKNDRLGLPVFTASVPNFVSWRERSRMFDAIGGVGFGNYTLTSAGEPEQLAGNRLSPSLPRVFGIAPVAGRFFLEEEEQPGGAPVAMVGEGLWKRRFGGDPGLVGRVVTLNGIPTTIVGIAPAALNLVAQADVYLPLSIDPKNEIRLSHTVVVFGRMKKGVTFAQVQAEMEAVGSSVVRDFPEIRDWGIHVLTLADTYATPELRTGLVVLVGAVLAVLLIACANIANLLLARGAAREREMAVRTSIGASPARLVRQVLGESLVLSTIGGLLGIAGAFGAVGAVNRLLPPNLLPVPEVHVDLNVVAFALVLTLFTGLLFGAAPAWRLARANLHDVLKRGGRGSSRGLGRQLRSLAAAEMALATVLLTGSGLLIRSLLNLENVRLGFDPGNLMTFELAPPPDRYPLKTRAPQLYRDLVEAVSGLPGVKGVAVSSGIPFGGGNYTTSPLVAEDASLLPPGTSVALNWRTVTPGYFRTMRIPLVSGREFTEADDQTAQRVVLVSRNTARQFWGDVDPIGRTLRRVAAPTNPAVVVGVVGDVRDTSLNQEARGLYYPVAQRVLPLMDIVVRTDADPEKVLPALRQAVRQQDPELALANVKTMDEWLSASAALPRANALLLGIFATLALVVAAIGIYGVLAYSVSQRTSEIGVRMALGASTREVLRLIVLEGMALALAGIGFGLLGGLALGRSIAALVYGLKVHDPATFGGSALLLAAVALAACGIPARRASRLDPLSALRCD